MDHYEYKLAMREARREILAITEPSDADDRAERMQTALFTVLGIMAALQESAPGSVS
jgi:hypothetical protein